MLERNKALTQRFYEEVVNRGDLSLVDELLAPDHVEHELLAGVKPGREGVKQLFAGLREAFPNLKTSVDDLLADGNKVVARVTMSGTQAREFMGIPATGKSFRITVIDIMKFDDGRITEHWGVSDTGSLIQQLTGVASPG